MDHSFIEQNHESRQRLESLCSHLSDADLSHAAPAGWTVAALLAHLAFWDQRALVLLQRWRKNGVDLSPVNSDAMNDALKPLCLALEPRRAVELCLVSASAVDAALETLTPDLVAEIEASPTHFRFDRSLHRRNHLGEIERLIGAGK